MCTMCTAQLEDSCPSAGSQPKEPMETGCGQLTRGPAGYGSWVPGARQYGGGVYMYYIIMDNVSATNIPVVAPDGPVAVGRVEGQGGGARKRARAMEHAWWRAEVVAARGSGTVMLPQLESMQIRLNSNYAMLLRHRSNPNPTSHKVQHLVLWRWLRVSTTSPRTRMLMAHERARGGAGRCGAAAAPGVENLPDECRGASQGDGGGGRRTQACMGVAGGGAGLCRATAAVHTLKGMVLGLEAWSLKVLRLEA
ncbi:hypothetical protein GGX14DRAFT_395541 [Mycena pura]|uniref:Uncharacterized protein n=1 Tax=Mycena pura TaxID=153505 RepID=A0AAD6VDF4_9AGAR|nr:hypothetical protein GGX14DRAFT_395541 [Mycena pura]